MYSYIAIICIGDRVRAKNKFLKLVGYFIRYSSIITDCQWLPQWKCIQHKFVLLYSYTGICLAIVIIVQELVSVVALVRSWLYSNESENGLWRVTVILSTACYVDTHKYLVKQTRRLHTEAYMHACIQENREAT